MTAAAPEPAELSARDLIGRVARVYLAPRWKGLAGALVAAVVVAVLSAQLVRILEPAVNDLMVTHKPGALIAIPLAIAAMAIGRGLAQVIQASLINRIGNAVVGDVQVQLFGKLVRADLAHLRTQHSGAYVSSVLYDAGLIREAATAGIINYTQHFLTVLGAIAVMVSNDLWLSLVLVVAAPAATESFSAQPCLAPSHRTPRVLPTTLRMAPSACRAFPPRSRTMPPAIPMLEAMAQAQKAE